VKYHEDNSSGGHGWWLSASHRQALRYAGKSVIVALLHGNTTGRKVQQ